MDIYGEVWYSNCRALQSKDFWYVLVKICAKAVATIAQDANTSSNNSKTYQPMNLNSGMLLKLLTEPYGVQVQIIDSCVSYAECDEYQS